MKQQIVGTEVSIVYDENMQPIENCNYIVGRVGSVKIDDLNVPYHAFHNHGSNKTFSIADIFQFTSRDSMRSITAVGNSNNLYCVMSTNVSNKHSYREFLSKKMNETIFVYKNKNYSILDLKKEFVSQLDDNTYNNLMNTVEKFIEKCVMESEKYGFKYYYKLT